MKGINTTENSSVPVQTPPFTGGVWAGTALFPMAHQVVYGNERTKICN